MPRLANTACIPPEVSEGGGGTADIVEALDGVYRGLSYMKFSY
jgi:hypothetical protein